jgi:methyl-accepting chemotaxis protein
VSPNRDTDERARSIGRAIVLPAAGLLLVVLVALGLAAWTLLSDELVRAQAARAQVAADSLGVQVDVSNAVSPGDAESIEAAKRVVADAFQRDSQLLFFTLVGPKGKVFTHLGKGIESDQTAALEALAASPTPGRMVNAAGRRAVVARGNVAFSGISAADVAPPPPGQPAGHLVVGVSLYAAEVSRQRLVSWLAVAAVCALLLYVGAMALVVRRISRRLRLVRTRARAVAEGDLTARVGDTVADELGAVARAFDGATERIGRVVERIADFAEGLEATGTRIARAAASVRAGAVAQRSEADDTARVADEVAGALTEIARRAEAARGEAQSGASATQRISAAAEGVSRGVDEAEQVVDSAAGGVATITRAIGEVADRAEEVSGAAASTSSALHELNVTIHRVRETAEAAARLAETAGGDAEKGQQALSATLDGIDRIREASRAVSEVTITMERRAREIGVVLQLVGDLTERTNLLALNASIIAAQAGVEGRGFAVVATEIKELARRTAASAGEIATLVAGVEEDSLAARRAAEVGARSVEEGAERARATARALSEIFNRVRDSAQLSLSIARSTEEQVRASRHVADAMGQVTGSVELIARATSDQRRQGEELALLAERLRGLVRTVGEATREQRDGARRVAGSVDSLKTSVEQVASAQRARAGDGARIRGALAQIRTFASGHEGSVTALDEAVADLRDKAAALIDEIERLRTT